MSFRTDTPVASTKKLHKCRWCYESIGIGEAMVRVAGVTDGDLWNGKFHPECWRSERHDWWINDEDSWPEDRLCRGTCDLSADKSPPQWSSAPVSKDEASYPREYREAMRLRPVSVVEVL